MNHWICKSCKGYNDILSESCIFCTKYKPEFVTSSHQKLIEIQRDIYLKTGIYGICTPLQGEKPMTDKEELFLKLFNRHKILVKDMDDSQLREHRAELAEIAFEAKATLSAADEEIRERNAKNPKKEWLVTTDTSISVSDAINSPKARKERMSKMDKLKNQLLSAGIDEETVKIMVANMEKKATEKGIKTITFNKPVTEIAAVRVQEKKDNSEPFDASKLNFGG